MVTFGNFWIDGELKICKWCLKIEHSLKGLIIQKNGNGKAASYSK